MGKRKRDDFYLDAERPAGRTWDTDPKPIGVTPYQPRCAHTGARPVWQDSTGRLIVHAAAGSHLRLLGIDIVLDLAGAVRAPKEFVSRDAPASWRALNRHVTAPQIVQFTWRDGDAPPVDLRFWRRVLGMLRAGPGKRTRHVAVCCMGGHGRTGTALAALMIADGVAPATAIAHVRQHHCAEAIETREQEDYLATLLDGDDDGQHGQRSKKD